MRMLSFGCAALVFGVWLLAACNNGKTSTPSASPGSKITPPSGNSVVDSLVKKYGAHESAFLPGSIKVTKATIQPTAVKHVTGDVRPSWLVSGYIENLSDHHFSRVRLHVVTWDAATHSDVDQTDVDLHTDLSPHQTVGFARTVQLLAPRGKWEWDCAVVDALEAGADLGINPRDEIRIYKDGNKWCATFGDFVDLEESESGWGDTPEEALASLLHRQPK